MDILLAHAYFIADDPVEQRIMKPYIPLGILALAAYLERAMFEVGVFDATFSSPDRFEERIRTERPRTVGIYVNMMTKSSALRLCAISHANGARVILGGPEPASYASEYLANGADVIVFGEAEETLAALLATDLSKDELRTVDGVAYIDDNGTFVQTAPRRLLASLDSLPQPARKKADLQPYIDAWRARHGYSSLSAISMRGCPFTCTWCSHGVYGESYRRRSASLFVDELETISNDYSPDRVYIADDVFTINHRWIAEFAAEIGRRKLSLRYECITRADRMNEDVVNALHSSGCERVWIGSESGSQRILDAMSRGVRVEQIASMTKLARRHGISVGWFVMLGFGDETHDDIRQTIRHIRDAQPDEVLTTTAYPIKGTSYYETSKATMHLPSMNWREWNDRMIDLPKKYSRRYYWFTHRRIANESRRNTAGARRSLRVRVESFFKAKAAQVGMNLFRLSHG